MLNLKNTLDGYLKNVEVIGNTVQDVNNLADIRSVGDRVDGQELYKIDVVSCGKNLFNISQNLELGALNSTNGTISLSDRSNNLNKNTNEFSVNVISQYGGVVSDFIKIKPNTTYTFSGTKNGNFAEQSNLCYFDKNKNVITGGWNDKPWRKSFTTPSNACYLKIGWWLFTPNTISYSDIQLEEGTQATPYEPYGEDKLGILSPVQLEKVGDVADRIICKDGVWGVEKNILNKRIDKSQNIAYIANYGNVYRYDVTGMHDIFVSNLTAQDIICDKYTPVIITTPNVEGIAKHGSNGTIQIQSKISDLQEFKNQLNINIKVKADTPQFIPLPHDQQVKLRTFAGQTNIAFLTEIGGQIKAQVPKSLGAVVNTHTEQIEMLHNALKSVLAGDMYSLATLLYPEDFEQNDNTEQDIMVIPE